MSNIERYSEFELWWSCYYWWFIKNVWCYLVLISCEKNLSITWENLSQMWEIMENIHLCIETKRKRFFFFRDEKDSLFCFFYEQTKRENSFVSLWSKDSKSRHRCKRCNNRQIKDIVDLRRKRKKLNVIDLFCIEFYLW